MNVLMGARPMLGAGRMVRGGLFFDGFGHVGFLLTLVFAAVAIGLIVWVVVRRPKPAIAPSAAPQASDTALAIARERLARGEIEPEQYVAILDALHATPGAERLSPVAPSSSLEG